MQQDILSSQAEDFTGVPEDAMQQDLVPNADENAADYSEESMEMTPIYAVGSIAAEFPSVGVQREYEFERSALAQGGPTEQHNLHQVLRTRRHLARSMCWILRVHNMDAYHLLPSSETELDQLIQGIEPAEEGRPPDTDVVIGWKGPSRQCAGMTLPALAVETMYSFDVSALIETMAESLRIEQANIPDFTAGAREVFDRVRQIADNLGELPEHRTLNYVAVRFAALYQTAASAVARDLVLSGIEARPSRLSSATQRILDVILTFQPRQLGAMEQYFVRVDVTDLYPHVLTTAMQPFFER